MSERTPEEDAELRARFRAIRRRLMMLTPVMFGSLMAVILRAKAGVDIDSYVPYATYVSLGVLAASVVYCLWVWRCPGCRKYLRKQMSPSYCPACGMALLAEPTDAQQ